MLTSSGGCSVCGALGISARRNRVRGPIPQDSCLLLGSQAPASASLTCCTGARRRCCWTCALHRRRCARARSPSCRPCGCSTPTLPPGSSAARPAARLRDRHGAALSAVMAWLLAVWRCFRGHWVTLAGLLRRANCAVRSVGVWSSGVWSSGVWSRGLWFGSGFGVWNGVWGLQQRGPGPAAAAVAGPALAGCRSGCCCRTVAHGAEPVLKSPSRSTSCLRSC